MSDPAQPSPTQPEEGTRTNNHLQDRQYRSRSRSRFSFASKSAQPSLRQSDRSTSRASFLGRSRQRTPYAIADTDLDGKPTSGSSAQRWRSESRTVRGSEDLNHQVIGDGDDYVFTSDDENPERRNGPTDLRGAAPTEPQTRQAYKDSSLPPPPDQGAVAGASQPQESVSSGSTMPNAGIEAPSSTSGEKADKGKADLEKQSDGQEQQQDRPPRLSRIPYPIAHFLGYRTKETENRALLRPLEKLPRKLESLIWAWIGAMLGLSFVMIIFSRWDQFSSSSNRPTTAWTAPIIIGSFGASSVILYGTPASPLGQPKSFVVGQFLCALVGCCVLKLFQLNGNFDPMLIDDSHSLVWVAGGISVAIALVAMMLTDTIHPPGGATALLITTSPPVIHLGWHYLPVVLLTSVVMVAWAMLWINLGRGRYPAFWIHPSKQAVSLATLGISFGQGNGNKKSAKAT